MKKLTCHCGEVEIQVNLQKDIDKLMRCNCSMCKRKGAMVTTVNKENIPSPSNPDVKILNIKSGYYAAIIYSGRTSDKNFIKHKSILENELKKDDMSILSPPIKATYNGPFTLPMNRRNEVMFEINVKDKGEI